MRRSHTSRKNRPPVTPDCQDRLRSSTLGHDLVERHQQRYREQDRDAERAGGGMVQRAAPEMEQETITARGGSGDRREPAWQGLPQVTSAFPARLAAQDLRHHDQEARDRQQQDAFGVTKESRGMRDKAMRIMKGLAVAFAYHECEARREKVEEREREEDQHNGPLGDRLASPVENSPTAVQSVGEKQEKSRYFCDCAGNPYRRKWGEHQ